MKLSRQYLLGLGSGLILSALISMVVSPTHVTMGQGSGAETSMSAQSQGTAASPAENNVNSQAPAQAAVPGSREFTIPSGASAEKIADLLQGQGFIADKKIFLQAVERKRAANRFQAGTFKLAENLSVEEVLEVLLAPKGH